MIIDSERIQVGQKIPSERYLSENLNVSRQSVREALRALEFLGIIYVKRGEGTYLADIDSHQLFELIAKYLVRTDKQRRELSEVQHMMEEYVGRKTGGDETVLSYDNKIMRKIYVILKKYTGR
ncbi:GntR family transcriptional regulator [Lacicoccus alkaliphilus]|uniref:Regulatory protein, gntR family n=2 Tax=Lacicoccus TaxID=3076172 RepID=A0A1M7AMW0_9BACL|nr:regulatory protein, gntR family [Salinicoccus alkaliphilus DSM 16010]